MNYVKIISILLGLTIISWLAASTVAFELNTLHAYSLNLTVSVAAMQTFAQVWMFWKIEQAEKALQTENTSFAISTVMLENLLNAHLRFGLFYPWLTTFVFSALRDNDSLVICGIATVLVLPHLSMLVRLHRQA